MTISIKVPKDGFNKVYMDIQGYISDDFDALVELASCACNSFKILKGTSDDEPMFFLQVESYLPNIYDTSPHIALN